MKSATPPISWAMLSSSNLAVIPNGMQAPFQLTGVLQLVGQDSLGYFSMSGNTLTIAAPQGTPLQVNWQQPTVPIQNSATGPVNLTFAGIYFNATVVDNGEVFPIGQEYPLSFIIQANDTSGTVVVSALNNPNCTLYVTSQSSAILASICANNQPTPKNGGLWKVTYTLVFQGSDGNPYIWDPGDDIEHGGGGGGIIYRRPKT